LIDLHCHLLPGIDDGPNTIEESIALARAAVAMGTRTTVVTPHVNRFYQNDAATIGRLTNELGERLVQEGVELEIRPGAEIALTRVAEIAPAQLTRLRLGGGPWLLVEPPFTPAAGNLDGVLLDVQRQGHRVVLAHPERCAAFRSHPKMLGALVRSGMLTSVTAASLVGGFGEEARRFVLAMAREELLHNVASDAHNRDTRPPGMTTELDQAGLGQLAEWLTQTVPAAILSGAETIPPRPSPSLSHPKPTRGRRWLPLRR
jgi:protein-tyrosine phosphatase